MGQVSASGGLLLTGGRQLGRFYAAGGPSQWAKVCTAAHRAIPIHNSVLDVPALPLGVGLPSAQVGAWGVAVVLRNNERLIVGALQALGLGFYLPQTEVWVREPSTGKRRREVRILWRDYVPFCVAFPEDEYIVRQFKHVHETLKVSNQKKFTDALDTVHGAIAAGFQVNPCPRVTIGTKCRVISGPLMGREGEVIRRDGNTLLVIQSDMLGAATIEVAPEMVEPIAD